MTASPPETFTYETFTSRNSGYVADDVQQRIRDITLMIAGCGMGSSTAICAARMGFTKFILVDGDTVGVSNLNRQFFDAADIGLAKVDALKNQILRINPEAKVEAINAMLNADNIGGILARADIIFDTVDFVDLPAILALHGTAQALAKPILTAINVGFGGLLWYFPPDGMHSLPDILTADANAIAATTGATPSYSDIYGRFIGRLAPFLDAEVLAHMQFVLDKMKTGTPCPASQVAPGAFTVAAMATSAMRDILSGAAYPASPTLLIHSQTQHRTHIVDFSTL